MFLPHFLTTHTPCKHMFAVFQHFHWSWHDLPDDVKNSPHMTLDNHDIDPLMNENSNTVGEDAPSVTTVHEDAPSVTTVHELPCNSSKGKQVYKLQKAVEDSLGQCRTLPFLTSDISVLEDVLLQCNTIMNTLTSSACVVTGPNTSPVFNSIAKVGVEEFRSQSNVNRQVGVKRKPALNKREIRKA